MKNIFLLFFVASVAPVLLISWRVILSTKVVKWRALYWLFITLLSHWVDYFLDKPEVFYILCGGAFSVYIAFEIYLLGDSGKEKATHDRSSLKKLSNEIKSRS